MSKISSSEAFPAGNFREPAGNFLAGRSFPSADMAAYAKTRGRLETLGPVRWFINVMEGESLGIFLGLDPLLDVHDLILHLGHGGMASVSGTIEKADDSPD